MKFTTIIVALTAAAVSVGAVPTETNGERFARGLPPLPPVRRGTQVAGARRSNPSQTPPTNQCNTGALQCCNSVTTASNPLAKIIIGLLGIIVGPTVAVGLTCSPLSIIGLGSNSCTAQPVCCTNNSFNGLIALGCTPININL